MLGYFPQSSSASRFTAGAFGFLTLIQCGDRPGRINRAEPLRHDALTSKAARFALSDLSVSRIMLVNDNARMREPCNNFSSRRLRSSIGCGVAPTFGAGGLSMGSGPRARSALRQHCRPAYCGNKHSTCIVPLDSLAQQSTIRAMGFNRRKLKDQRREAAEKEAANRRATDAQVLEDAERLIAAWNERQAKRMPMLFSPTIGAAIKAGYWFVWVRCPACHMTSAIDLRGLDRHSDAAVTSLIPALSCRSCRPNAPFAELVRLSRTSIADEMREEYRRRVLDE
jgi:hypothetical protein